MYCMSKTITIRTIFALAFAAILLVSYYVQVHANKSLVEDVR